MILVPCSCGETEDLSAQKSLADDTFSVVCGSCGNSGPNELLRWDAWKGWNRMRRNNQK